MKSASRTLIPCPMVILVAVAMTVVTLSLTGAVGQLFARAQELNSTVGSQEPAPKSATEDDLVAAAKGPTDQRVEALLRLSDGTLSPEKVVPVLARATTDGDELVRAAGEVGIQRLGKASVPALVTMVGDGYLNNKDFVPVCGAVRVVGIDAVELFPKFQQALNSDDGAVQKMALFAMQNLGDENLMAMDRLIELLDDKDLNVQIGVCRILEKLGPKAAPAIDKIVDLIENGRTISAKSWAAIVLGAIGESKEHDILGLLTQRLDAFTLVEKQRAMIGLGHLGAKAKPAVKKVTQLMNDPSKHCQPQAAVTLWQITGKTEESLEVLQELLPKLDYNQTVLEQLATMGPAAAPLTSTIAEYLSSEDVAIRELAALALGKIGPQAKSAVPQLKTLLKDNDALLRQAVTDAIAAIEKPPTKEKPKSP